MSVTTKKDIVFYDMHNSPSYFELLRTKKKYKVQPSAGFKENFRLTHENMENVYFTLNIQEHWSEIDIYLFGVLEQGKGGSMAAKVVGWNWFEEIKRKGQLIKRGTVQMYKIPLTQLRSLDELGMLMPNRKDKK